MTQLSIFVDLKMRIKSAITDHTYIDIEGTRLSSKISHNPTDLGPVVRQVDSALHRIVIFSAATEMDARDKNTELKY